MDVDEKPEEHYRNGESRGADSARVARRRLALYHHRLLDGCGSKGCANENCASSGRLKTNMSANEAAARALKLLKDNAPVCPSSNNNNELHLFHKNHKAHPPPSSSSGSTSAAASLRHPNAVRPPLYRDTSASTRPPLHKEGSPYAFPVDVEEPSASSNITAAGASLASGYSSAASAAAASEARLKRNHQLQLFSDPHASDLTSSKESTPGADTDAVMSSFGTTIRLGNPDVEFRRKSTSSDDIPPPLIVDATAGDADHSDIISQLPLSARHAGRSELMSNFNEARVDELIAKAQTAEDVSYSELRKVIGEIFCNPDHLSRAFRTSWNSPSHRPASRSSSSGIATEDVIDVDVESVRRTFDKMFQLTGRPFLTSLCNAVNNLCDNLVLDLKYQNMYEREPAVLNIFVILMELPIMDAHEYFDGVLGNFCKAAAALPAQAQARLCRFWASCHLREASLLTTQSGNANGHHAADPAAHLDSRNELLSKMQALQHYISVRVATRPYNRNSPAQEDAELTAAARVLKLIYYAALYGALTQASATKFSTKNLMTDSLTTSTNSKYLPSNPISTINSPTDDNFSDFDNHVANPTTNYMNEYDDRWSSTPDGGGLGSSRRRFEDDSSSGHRTDPLGAALGIRPADVRQPLLPFEEFYNEVLSETVEMDLDFLNYKVVSTHGDDDTKFSFMLTVPFMLTPACKMKGLWFDNRIRMYAERRTAAVQSLLRGEDTAPYLKIKVRRDSVVQDALLQLDLVSGEQPSELKKQLYVEFDGEQGVDEGGLSKEFYQLITQQLFNPDYGMWTYNQETRLFWFSPQEVVQRDEYGLVGILFGLAIYNNIILDVQFPMVLYRKLMGNPGELEDLVDVDPTLYRSLTQLLEHPENDIEEVFCLTFEVTYQDVFGHTHTRLLKRGGKGVIVDRENRQEFVYLYVDFLLNGLVRQAFEAFRRGFELVITDSPLPWMFRPEEIEELVCGSTHWDFKALEESADYDNNLGPDHQLVKWFWSIVHEMSEEEKRLLLQFTTGSDRVPVGGLANVKFIIAKNGPDSEQLPTSHTCYNVLLLPEYSSREKLKDRLLIAIKNCKGFGLQ